MKKMQTDMLDQHTNINQNDRLQKAQFEQINKFIQDQDLCETTSAADAMDRSHKFNSQLQEPKVRDCYQVYGVDGERPADLNCT